MMKNKDSSLLFLLVFTLMALVAISTVSVEAQRHRLKKSKPHKHLKGTRENSRNTPSDAADIPTPCPTQEGIFDVLSFGAKGDGVSDDSNERNQHNTTTALLATWKAACKVRGATVEIPAGYKFVIKPITLQGPCMPHLVLQIDGTLLAPPKVGSWPKSSLFQFLNFKWIHDFTIQGSGFVDGQGSNWWSPSQIYHIQKRYKHMPDMKPTALRFYASNNVTVRDIKIVNSPQCHLKFDGSDGVKVSNISISSPEISPNTDGIHLQNTRNVEIHHSNIACGDDCVSIQTGCSNVHIHNINCGPGHGISLGGLGKDKSVACVSDIIVEQISVQNALYGVRIKTWQGGLGSVKNVSFSNIQVTDVKLPIMIDQFYCDKTTCKNQTGAVAITGVKYEKIIGSFTVQPVHLACSNNIPCTDVDLVNIQLKPSGGYRGFQQALCWNSYGKKMGPLLPSSIDYCLRSNGGGSLRRTARSHKNICHF